MAAMTSLTVHNCPAIAASGSTETDGVNLHNRAGIFSLFYTLTGTGTGKIEYQISYDDVTYAEPSEALDVGTGLTAGSDFISFEPVLAPFIRLKITETGGANSITISSI